MAIIFIEFPHGVFRHVKILVIKIILYEMTKNSIDECTNLKKPEYVHENFLYTAVFPLICFANIPKESVTSGYDIANELTTNYNNKAADRGSGTAPAFLCSGVMLQGTDPSVERPWISSSAESFSFIRKDAKFSKLAYSRKNGFIFYPYFSAPTGKAQPDILCIFPVAGETETRSDNGCGASSVYPEDSGSCQAQRIYTANQWYTQYNEIAGSSTQEHEHQCGFDVSNEYCSGSATAFEEALTAIGM